MPPAISLVLTYRLQLTRLYMLCHCGCQPGCLCAAGSQSLVSLFHSMCFSMCVSTRLHPEPSLMPLYSLSPAAASASDCLHCVVPRTLSAKPCHTLRTGPHLRCSKPRLAAHRRVLLFLFQYGREHLSTSRARLRQLTSVINVEEGKQPPKHASGDARDRRRQFD